MNLPEQFSGNSVPQLARVFVLPVKMRNNKYLELFTAALEKRSPRVKVERTTKGTVGEVWRYVRKNRGSATKDIIHIHWSTTLYGSRFVIKSLTLLIWNGLMLSLLKIFLGCRIVWTVHNAKAHDYPHPWVDWLGRSVLGILSDAIVVQQKVTLTRYRRRYPNKQIEYVPHGNYIGAYGKRRTEDCGLRKSFGFTDKDIVLLSFGAIAPYKRNECIIEAVYAAQKQAPDIKLVIVGKGTEAYVQRLTNSIPKDANILITNTFVPDEAVPAYLDMADYSIFYYDDSEMTSGGIILSLSYGVPVLARNIPATEILNGSNGHAFDTQEELQAMLCEIVRPSRGAAQSAIMASVKSLDWDKVGERLEELYECL